MEIVHVSVYLAQLVRETWYETPGMGQLAGAHRIIDSKLYWAILLR